MKAVIDADLVAYRCSASCKDDDEEEIALFRADGLMQEIISSVGADSYSSYITQSDNNFRKTLTTTYKENRKDQQRPQHLEVTQQFLMRYWKTEMCDGYEADDALGIEATKDPKNTIICSLDKDLLQIPGQHYNWVKKEFKQVTPDEGLLSFFISTLVGDRSDNITGIYGLGPVKASKILEPLLPEEYYQACREQYNNDDRYHLNCQLLWIWRTMNGIWEPPLESRS